jgi:aminopeptidase
LHDPRLATLADVIVRYCTRVKAGDLVTIVSDPGAMPAIEAIFTATLRAGGFPSFHPRSESLHELLLRHGSDAQLRHVSPFERHRLEGCDVLIVLNCSHNTRYLEGIEPSRIVMAQAARRELLTMSLQRLAQGKVRYVCTEIPSHAAAQDAGMSLTEYSDWVYRAGFLHLPDPVEAWQKLQEQQQRAIDVLSRARTLRFRAPACEVGPRRHDGTDLTVDIEGGTWQNHAGANNFPDGEVETGPRSANGVVNFNLPALFRGREVDGVRLKFRAGRVVEASATRNEDFLIATLDQDAGARVMGEIAIGTNYQLSTRTRNAFFDEKVGGTFHLAVGAGYPQSGNSNQSALHWDMVCDLRPDAQHPGSPGGTIHADEELVQENGRFTRPGWPGY